MSLMRRSSVTSLGSAPDHAVAHSAVTSLLYVSFFLAGCAIASYGVLLPLLLPALHRSDAEAGLLLFGFFAGSSVGSLFARGRLWRAFAAGCLLTAVSAAALATLHNLPPLVPTTVYGFGLGLCMTSVSLQQSRAQVHRRVAEFARLNLIWAAGALAGPVFCLYVARRSSAAPVFLTIAQAFAIIAFASFLVAKGQWVHAPQPLQNNTRPLLPTVLPILLVLPLTTGLESAAGGWLTLYAARTQVHTWHGKTLPILFWSGLLLCRFVYSFQTFTNNEVGTLRTLAWVACAGTVLLAIGHVPLLLFAGSALLGWGIGTLYPVALAMLLRRTELGNVGFLLAGLGSALIPLTTGVVATAFHSLQAGICFLLLPTLLLVTVGTYLAHQRRGAEV